MSDAQDMNGAAPGPEGETTEETVTRLAALAPLEYDQVRDSESTRMGVRLTTLDAEVAKLRKETDPLDAGVGLDIPDIEPWLEPVNGSDLLHELVEVIGRYLILPPHAAETIALWVLHAHLISTAWISPILAVTSPSPECGKTTLLDLLAGLVPRPLAASNITGPSLFRAIEKWSPTMLIDEADTFMRNSDELRGIVNSGHRRSSAFVIRTVGEDYDPQQFRTWAAKAIALIGKLPETLESRSIEIELRRKKATERVEGLRSDRLQHLEPIRRRCARFAEDAAAELLSADPVLPPTLYGRAADNWRHLIAIADVAGGSWPLTAREAATAAAAVRTEQTAAIMLLGDIRALFAERQVARLASAELVVALGGMEDRPWPEWKNGSAITARQLARLLEPFGIRPTALRIAGHKAGTRGYEHAFFADAFARYLSEEPPVGSATPQQASKAAISGAFDPQRGPQGVAVPIGSEAAENKDCCGVADREGEPTRTTWSSEDWQALRDERAAIMEFDGGLPRHEAEARAEAEVRQLMENGFGGPEDG